MIADEDDKNMQIYPSDYAEKLLLTLADRIGLPVYRGLGSGMVQEGVKKMVQEMYATGIFVGCANDDKHKALIQKACAPGTAGIKFRLIKEEAKAP